MNSAARRIVQSTLVAVRAVDPDGAEQLSAALAQVGDKRKDKPESLLLTQSEAARLYGCSRWTIRNLVRDGKLHPVRLRGAVKYRRSELLALAGEAD